MAEPRFTKSDLLEIFQDSYDRRDGNISGIIDELKSFINTETQQNDSFVQNLKENESSMKSFYEEYVEMLKSGMRIDGPGGLPTEKPIMADEATFREILDRQMSMNSGAVTNALTSFGDRSEGIINGAISSIGDRSEGIINGAISSIVEDNTGKNIINTFDNIQSKFFKFIDSDMNQALSEIYSGVEDQIDFVFGEEKKALYDPMMNVVGSIGRVMGHFKSPEEESLDIARDSYDMISDSNDVLISMYDQQPLLLESSDDVLSVSEDTNRILLGITDNLNDNYDVMSDISDSLDDTYTLNKEESLRDQRKIEKDGFWESFVKGLAIAAAAGLVLGATLRSILLPFEVLRNLLLSTIKAVSNLVLSIKNFSIFSRAPKVPKVAGDAGKISTFISNTIAGISKVLKPLKELRSVRTAILSILAFFESVRVIGFMPTLLTTMKNMDVLPKWFRGVTDFFSRMFRVATGMTGETTRGSKILAKVGQFSGWISKQAGMVWGVFKEVLKFFDKFSILKKFFSIGFRLFGKKLAIIFAIFDFIKGFATSTEESLIGKIKDGVKNAIVKFFELPLLILGWIWDKALGLFGIESKGTGDKLVKWLGNIIDLILSPIVSLFNSLLSSIGDVFGGVWKIIGGVWDYFKNLFGFFKSILTLDFSAAGEYLDGMWEALVNVVQGVFGAIFGIILAIPKALWSFIKSIWSGVSKDLQGTFLEPVVDFINTIAKFVSDIVSWVKDKIKSIPLIGDFFKDETDKLKDANKKDLGVVSKKQEEISKIDKDILKIEEERKVVMAKEYTGWFGGKLSPEEQEKERQKDLLDLKKDQDKLQGKKSAIQSEISEKSVEIENRNIALQGATAPEVRSPDVISDGQKKDVVESYTTTTRETSTAALSSIGDRKVDGSVSYIPSVDEGMSSLKDMKPAFDMPDISDTVHRVEEAKQKVAKSQADRSVKMEQTISKAVKEMSIKEERPIVVNTGGGGDNRQMDPPEDIESMSILWLNKSWGLG